MKNRITEEKLDIDEIETDRLVLRPLGLSHLSNNYVAWLNDPEVVKYISHAGDYNIKRLEIYLQEVEKKHIYFWAIHLKKEGNHIGNIKIDPINMHHGLGSYGIMMGEKLEWNKGYAEEASLGAIDFCFKNIGLRKITLEVILNNKPAVALYKKIGFQIEGIRKKQELHGNIYCDSYIMANFNPEITYAD